MPTPVPGIAAIASILLLPGAADPAQGAISGASADDAPVVEPVGRPADERPNLLFLLSDAHRASALGCYGHEAIRTPSLDRLAEEGTLFSNAHSTTPVCRPMRFTNLTGLHAFRGAYGAEIDHEAHPAIARVLGAAGYDCGYVGKWHLGPVDLEPGDPRRMGFDGYWRVIGNREGRRNHAASYRRWSTWSGPGEPEHGEGFRPDALVEHAREFIAAERDGPFCLYVSFGPPHAPFVPPAEHDRHEGVEPRGNVPEAVDAGEAYAGYAGLVEALDASIGRLLRIVEEEGLAESTVVLYTSDHGSQLGSHGRFGKGLPYAESVRVPLIVRWPGRVPAGRRTRALFGSIDFFPTLTTLLGVPAPDGLDGLDLSGVVLGRSGTPERESLYLECRGSGLGAPYGWRALKTPRYTYARGRQRPVFLFDDVADPLQLENRVDRDPVLVSRLDGLLSARMTELGDAWIAAPRDDRAEDEIAEPDAARFERALAELEGRSPDEVLRGPEVVRLYGLDVPPRRFAASIHVSARPDPHQLRRDPTGAHAWTVAEVRSALRAWLDLLASRAGEGE